MPHQYISAKHRPNQKQCGDGDKLVTMESAGPNSENKEHSFQHSNLNLKTGKKTFLRNQIRGTKS